MLAFGGRIIDFVENRDSTARNIMVAAFLVVIPVVTAYYILFLWFWDFSVPLAYGTPGADEVWQLVATKTLIDTGWVLENPFLGAPGISMWYGNSGSQTSALHSVIMLCISYFVSDAIKVQQYYFLLCCSLISISSFVTCRTLKMSTLPALAISILFCFTSYRLNGLFFAYLANYFIVPISLLPAIWIAEGKFNRFNNVRSGNEAPAPLKSLFQSKYTLLSIAVLLLTGISDGYYAFFTVLIIGFTTLIRILLGDLMRPSNMIVPLLCILTILSTAIALSYPIRQYRALHPGEANQDQMKQASDAEVYSPSLKLMIAPILNHRVQILANIGKQMVDTANFNRKFPYTTGATVVLGTFGTIFLVGSLFSLIRSATYSQPPVILKFDSGQSHGRLLIICSLAFFVLLTSISGGIGSLIAFIYPSIRAYDRFPIYLVFLVYLWAGLMVTRWLLNGSLLTRVVASTAVCMVSVLALLDQTPRDLLGLRSPGGAAARSARFLAERAFVQKIEAELPEYASIYQFPYSQYLTNNRYYGWGQFGQLRLYLHSRTLRWSNGGAKGSPVEDWHERQSLLPLSKLIVEMQSVGFAGVVVDRLVLPPDEYAVARAELVRLTGRMPVENDEARLAFWRLDPSPVELKYQDDYKKVESIIVRRPISNQPLPQGVNRAALERALQGRDAYPVVLDAETHPEIFYDGARFERGTGQTKIAPFTDMKGDINCPAAAGASFSSQEILKLELINRSHFDWHFNVGQFPLRIGIRITDPDGKMLKEFTVMDPPFVEAGGSQIFPVPLKLLHAALPELPSRVELQFAFLQDGNAWFSQPGNNECRISVRD